VAPADFITMIANAWPAAAEHLVGDWRLRWAWGLTRRANSVVATGSPWRSLDEAIEEAERFYKLHDAPTRFQVGDDPARRYLVAALAARSYTEDSPTLVMAASVASMLLLEASREWETHVANAPDDAWFSTYHELEPHTHPHLSSEATALRLRWILLRPTTASVFVTARYHDAPAAIGQGVLQGDWVAIQCLATRP
jgi:hypothetical protein